MNLIRGVARTIFAEQSLVSIHFIEVVPRRGVARYHHWRLVRSALSLSE